MRHVVALFALLVVATEAQLYASEGGSGTACSTGSPCTLNYAVTDGGGGEVWFARTTTPQTISGNIGGLLSNSFQIRAAHNNAGSWSLDPGNAANHEITTSDFVLDGNPTLSFEEVSVDLAHNVAYSSTSFTGCVVSITAGASFSDDATFTDCEISISTSSVSFSGTAATHVFTDCDVSTTASVSLSGSGSTCVFTNCAISTASAAVIGFSVDTTFIDSDITFGATSAPNQHLLDAVSMSNCTVRVNAPTVNAAGASLSQVVFILSFNLRVILDTTFDDCQFSISENSPVVYANTATSTFNRCLFSSVPFTLNSSPRAVILDECEFDITGLGATSMFPNTAAGNTLTISDSIAYTSDNSDQLYAFTDGTVTVTNSSLCGGSETCSGSATCNDGGLVVTGGECLSNATCTAGEGCVCNADNTEGDGVTACDCLPGYDTSECVDYNECTLDIDNCDLSRQNCSNTDGSFTCTCVDGYFQFDPITCLNYNECDSSPCPSGSICVDTVGSYTCVCPKGSIPSGLEDPFCFPCDEGHFTENDGEETCSECPTGKFQPDTGATSCVLCDPGTFTATNMSTECLPCDAGDYQADSGQSDCDPCPPGSFSNASEAIDCFLCSPGLYQNETGQQNCTSCPSGTASPDEGADECTSCVAGYFAADGASQECDPCPPGNFSNVTEMTSCFSCLSGTFSSSSASTSCAECDPGSFTDDDGLDECSLCAEDTYQSETGQTTCLSCPSGRSTNETTGAISCVCPAGKALVPGLGCADVNECSLYLCPHNAVCVNTAGSYHCACLECYELVGDACARVDDCDTPDTPAASTRRETSMLCVLALAVLAIQDCV